MKEAFKIILFTWFPNMETILRTTTPNLGYPCDLLEIDAWLVDLDRCCCASEPTLIDEY